MFSPCVLEEKYPIDGCIYNKIYYGDRLVAADTDDTLRVWTLQGELMWWQYPLHAHITCVALQGFQIAVGTEDGSVYILYCDTKNMKIEELNKLECCDDSCINQIRFLFREVDAITICMFFQPNKISIFEWRLDTIKKVEGKLPKAIDVPGEIFYHLDAIQRAEDPSKYLLFGINEKLNAISVRLVNYDGFSEEVKPTWNLTQAKSEIQILDISSHGWVLLAEDTCKRKTRGVRLIDVDSKKTHYGDPGFMCGCLLSTTQAEASFVVQDIKPSALRAYNWNADKEERTLLQTWGTKAPGTKNQSAIAKCVAGCNGNFIMVWDHVWKEECAALLFCRDHAWNEKCAAPLFCQGSPSIYPQPYKHSWLQPDSEFDKIIESAYWRNNSGALLVRRRKPKSYYVRCWTFDGNIFHLTEQLSFNRSKEKVKYTRIAMYKNIIAVCSKVIRKSVTVQLWRNNIFSETFEIGKVESKIIKLINLRSGYFCLITEKELIVFKDKSPPQRLNVNLVKDACYDLNSRQLKVLAHKELMIYDKKLRLKKFHKHSKISNEQIAMNSSNEDWVTLDDQSTLTYFSKGKLRLLQNLKGTVTAVSLNLLSGKNVMIKNKRTMQCFSVQNKKFALTWDLSCETGPRNWQVKESGGRYFLLTEYTFGVIESDQGVYKERILFGFKERDVSEAYSRSGKRILTTKKS